MKPSKEKLLVGTVLDFISGSEIDLNETRNSYSEIIAGESGSAFVEGRRYEMHIVLGIGIFYELLWIVLFEMAVWSDPA